MKIRPVGAELFHVDGQADRHDEAIVAFRNFANVPKNSKHAAGQRTKKVKSCDV
jgi:hypothetical protein